jgi:hypothetical protein
MSSNHKDGKDTSHLRSEGIQVDLPFVRYDCVVSRPSLDGYDGRGQKEKKEELLLESGNTALTERAIG